MILTSDRNTIRIIPGIHGSCESNWSNGLRCVSPDLSEGGRQKEDRISDPLIRIHVAGGISVFSELRLIEKRIHDPQVQEHDAVM